MKPPSREIIPTDPLVLKWFQETDDEREAREERTARFFAWNLHLSTMLRRVTCQN